LEEAIHVKSNSLCPPILSADGDFVTKPLLSMIESTETIKHYTDVTTLDEKPLMTEVNRSPTHVLSGNLITKTQTSQSINEQLKREKKGRD